MGTFFNFFFHIFLGESSVKDSGVNHETPLVAKMDKSNGSVQIIKNGSAHHRQNNNLDKKSVSTYDGSDLGWKKVRACMLKTFNRMKKRIGFLIYQFVLPALQVSLASLAQDTLILGAGHSQFIKDELINSANFG